MSFLIKKFKEHFWYDLTRRLVSSITITIVIVFTFLALINYHTTKLLFIKKNNEQLRSAASFVSYMVDAKIQDLNQNILQEGRVSESLKKIKSTSQLVQMAKNLKLFAVEIIYSNNQIVSSLTNFTKIKSEEELNIISLAKAERPLAAQFILKNNKIYIFVSFLSANGSVINFWSSLDDRWAASVSALAKMDIFIIIANKIIISNSYHTMGSLIKLQPANNLSDQALNIIEASIESTSYSVSKIPLINMRQEVFAHLIVGNNLQVLNDLLEEMIRWYVIAIVLSCLALTIIVVILTSIQIKSLKNLVNLADNITTFDSDIINEIPIAETETAEIKTLSMALNRMLQTLALHFKNLTIAKNEVEELNQKLEHRVQQKTVELEKSMAILIQTDKLAALGQMAGGVAHEINNPLAIINALAEQAYESILDNRIDKKFLLKATANIQNTVARITKVIAGLRSISRDGELDAALPTSVFQLIEECLGLCQERFRYQSIQLIVSEIPKDLIISCRATQIQQVLINLLNNAFDAVSNYQEKWIAIEVQDLDSNIAICVTDSGKGLDSKILSKIFHPFFTTKEIGKGTGLGLSVSVGLVESHFGKLYVDQKYPNTRFVIELPKLQKSKNVKK